MDRPLRVIGSAFLLSLLFVCVCLTGCKREDLIRFRDRVRNELVGSRQGESGAGLFSRRPAASGQAAAGKAQDRKGAKKEEKPLRPPPRVRLYTTSNCNYCRQMADVLEIHGVPYDLIDVSKNSKVKSVPRVEFSGGVVEGYRPEEVLSRLREQGYDVEEKQNRF